jgi:1-acyl-sn-glycerol-3-phosphate acyltransferase
MKYITSIYIWLMGGISYLFIFIFTLILSPFLSTKKLHSYFKFSSKIALWLMLYRFDINFETPLDKSKTYIYMPNHVSVFDVMVSAAYAPSYSNGIQAHSHFKIFFFGWILKVLKQIPINRTNIRESLKSFEIAKDRIKDGCSIILYPEGTRSKTGILLPFKKIPFRFAKDANVDVVIIGYIGIEKVSPQESVWVKPARITMNITAPIPKEEIEKMTVEELKDKVREKMGQLIGQ